jgi:hypothetical protein
MSATYYPGSLVNRVTEYVIQKGTATISEVSDQFSGYTKKQVSAALCNARDKRLLRIIARGSAVSKRDSVWAEDKCPIMPPRVVKKEKVIPVASVWELGTPPEREWPPRFEGGREFQLLGDWNAEEALAG